MHRTPLCGVPPAYCTLLEHQLSTLHRWGTLLLSAEDGTLVRSVSFISQLCLPYRCMKAGKWQTAGKADAWKLPTEGHRVFDGLRIFLNGDAAVLGPLRRLLPYAGRLSECLVRDSPSAVTVMKPPAYSSYSA